MPDGSARSMTWDSRPGTVRVLANDAPVLVLTPADGRVRVGIVLPPRGRVVDVSIQPCTAVRTVDDAARAVGSTPGPAHDAAHRALCDAAQQAGAWVPPTDADVLRAVGGVAFPLLGAAYDRGAEAVPEVPRWAAPVLASATIGDAARTAFGAAATRPVRRALVDAIAPLPTGDGASGQVDLSVLALALVAGPSFAPDRLARVLSTERVRQDPSSLPDPSTLTATRHVVATWGDVRVEQVLRDAAARPDGVAVLLRTARYARQLGDHGPAGPLPQRLQELHDLHRALIRTAAEPSARPEPAAPRARRRPGQPARPAARPEPRPRHQPLAPPSGLRAVRDAEPIQPTPTLRRLDGLRLDDLTLVLPHTAGDLVRWGRILSNCLGDFGPAAVAGRSVLIGVLRDHRLTYVVELTASGVVRQFCGRANRAPRDRDRRAVIGALAAHLLVDRHAPANRDWMGGVELPPASQAG